MKLPAVFSRKAKPQVVRSFDGAAGGRRGVGMGSFGLANTEIFYAGPMLRDRARYLARNNPWVANAIGNWTGSLVGAGIMPTAKHPDDATRKAINAYFGQWAARADATGRTDFFGLQAQIAESMVIDGEALALILDAEHGPELRVLPPDLIDSAKTSVDLGQGNAIFSGVEIDSRGKRRAFYIYPERPDQFFTSFAPSQRIDAASVLHVFKPVAPAQIRGASWLAPVILPASDLDKLLDALLMGAQVAAMHAGFLVDQNGVGGAPYDGTEAGGILDTGLEPGVLKRLPSGFDVKFNSPQQAQQMAEFVGLNLRQLAAGLGLPDHMVSGDLSNANYSSLRAGLLPFRQRVEQVQYGVIVPQFLAPIWRNVITYGILSGEIDAPDFEQNPEFYLTADWLPPKPMQVDPLKDVEATVAEIDAGLTSRRKAVAERGYNVEEIDAEIASDTFKPIQPKPVGGAP